MADSLVPLILFHVFQLPQPVGPKTSGRFDLGGHIARLNEIHWNCGDFRLLELVGLFLEYWQRRLKGALRNATDSMPYGIFGPAPSQTFQRLL